MTIDDLRLRLLNQNAEFEIIQHEIPIKSKKDALGYFELEETAPTLIIQTENTFYALIISGERNRIDFEFIGNLLGCNNVTMVHKKNLEEKFGFKSGQIPLIGHDLPCIIDNRIFKYNYVYGGTGDLYHTLKIKPADLVKANNVILNFD